MASLQTVSLQWMSAMHLPAGLQNKKHPFLNNIVLNILIKINGTGIIALGSVNGKTDNVCFVVSN